MSIFSWDRQTRTLTVNLPFKLRVCCQAFLVESVGFIGLNSFKGTVFVNTPMKNGFPVCEGLSFDLNYDSYLRVNHDTKNQYLLECAAAHDLNVSLSKDYIKCPTCRE